MLTDFLGNEITDGCWVVYPVRSGSHMWMQLGHVLDTNTFEVMGYEVYRHSEAPPGRPAIRAKNVVLVPKKAPGYPEIRRVVVVRSPFDE